MAVTELFSRHDRVAVYDGKRWNAGVVLDRDFDWLLVAGELPGGVFWTRRVKRSQVAKVVRMVRVVGGVKFNLEKRA